MQSANFVIIGVLILAFALGLRPALQRYGGGIWAPLPAACVVVAYRFAKFGRKGWAGYSVTTAVVFLISFVLTSMGFSQHPTFMPIGGLLQRLTLIVGFAWLTALALHLLSQGGRRPAVAGLIG